MLVIHHSCIYFEVTHFAMTCHIYVYASYLHVNIHVSFGVGSYYLQYTITWILIDILNLKTVFHSTSEMLRYIKLYHVICDKTF